MRTIDFNVDAGEYTNGVEQQREREILALVSRCNIAYSGHAGDEESMCHTLHIAKRCELRCGAHLSYPDKQGFGRRALSILLTYVIYGFHLQGKYALCKK